MPTPHLPATFMHQLEDRSPVGSSGTAVAVAFSPDGQLLATCRRGSLVRIYR